MLAIKNLYGVYLMAVALVLLVIVLMSGCGKEKSKNEPDPPPPTDAAWAAIAPTVKQHCGGCHNGASHPLNLNSASAFKGSKSKARISNGTMPPNGTLPDDVKAKLLAYLG